MAVPEFCYCLPTHPNIAWASPAHGRSVEDGTAMLRNFEGSLRDPVEDGIKSFSQYKKMSSIQHYLASIRTCVSRFLKSSSFLDLNAFRLSSNTSMASMSASRSLDSLDPGVPVCIMCCRVAIIDAILENGSHQTAVIVDASLKFFDAFVDGVQQAFFM